MKEPNDGMYNEEGKAYGDLIREYRRRKHLSQEQLGAIAHVKKNAVGAWEAGRSRPDVASIPELCRALDMPLSVFFGVGGGASFNDPLSERFNRLSEHHQEIVMREMDMLYELQEAIPESKK